ncbi:hypothetical protein Tco_1217588 [Tanacetum coccineum]
MSTSNQQTLADSGVNERPPMLERRNYIPWEIMNYLLQAIPNDIYNSVDACKNAKEMWERIKRLMFGSDVTSHVRHSRLMDEFDKFAAKEGELLESVYERLTTLVNIMDRNNVRPILVSINTKFLNCLQPEWSKYVTMMKMPWRMNSVKVWSAKRKDPICHFLWGKLSSLKYDHQISKKPWRSDASALSNNIQLLPQTGWHDH